MTLPQLEQFIKDNIQQSVKAAIIIGAVRKHLLARADERDNKWISVEERLPDIKPGYDYSERVIVVDKNKYIYNSTFWEFSQTWEDDEKNVEDITHWQPLPKPPKK